MDKEIYAIVERGDYEERNVFVVKLDKNDKELFKKFCEHTENIILKRNDSSSILQTGYNDSIKLLAFTSDLEIIDNDDLYVETINHILDDIKNDIRLINKMGEHHYFYGGTDLLNELLDYKFTLV